jgi:hypothetical protein
VTSTIAGADGAAVGIESGNYYGVISGEGANQELVGIIVITSGDPRFGDGDVTVRETGGFIVYR